MNFLFHIKSDCCRYPFILMPSRTKRDELKVLSTMAHDHVHRVSLKKIGFFTFVWKYITNKKFRWAEERLAFTAEINFYKQRHCHIYKDAFVDLLLLEYTDMCTPLEALNFMKQF